MLKWWHNWRSGWNMTWELKVSTYGFDSMVCRGPLIRQQFTGCRKIALISVWPWKWSWVFLCPTGPQRTEKFCFSISSCFSGRSNWKWLFCYSQIIAVLRILHMWELLIEVSVCSQSSIWKTSVTASPWGLEPYFSLYSVQVTHPYITFRFLLSCAHSQLWVSKPILMAFQCTLKPKTSMPV